jgi:hypothetical protein
MDTVLSLVQQTPRSVLVPTVSLVAGVGVLVSYFCQPDAEKTIAEFPANAVIPLEMLLKFRVSVPAEFDNYLGHLNGYRVTGSKRGLRKAVTQLERGLIAKKTQACAKVAPLVHGWTQLVVVAVKIDRYLKQQQRQRPADRSVETIKPEGKK